MKRTILSLLVIAFAASVYAQEIPDRKCDEYKPHPMKHRHHDMAFKQLNLTDAQKEHFKAQKETMKKQIDELKKNENISVKDYRSRMESIRKEHKTKIESILTGEQKAQLQKTRQERMEKEKQRAADMRDRMKTRLGLSEEQSARLEKSRKESMDKMKAIRENTSLSDDQKREQVRSLHQQQKESLKSILTEEQMKKLKEGHHRDGDRNKDKDKYKDKEKAAKETI